MGHIPGAYHLSIRSDFKEQNLHAIVKKDQPAVIYCNGISCMGSSIATQKAIKWGWTNIFYYREGIKDWKQQNYPVHEIAR
jgi:rhodanese-related sulfurtransferase